MHISSLALLGYLDPGTGSLLLQVLAAILISSSVVFRRILWAPFSWLYSRRRRGQASER